MVELGVAVLSTVPMLMETESPLVPAHQSRDSCEATHDTRVSKTRQGQISTRYVGNCVSRYC